MKFFNLDSPVMVFLSKVANLMILNVLTIICCIPIFTAGAAIAARYYVTMTRISSKDTLSPLKRILSRRRSSG